MKITDFLEEMEKRGTGKELLFEGEGKEGGQVDASIREELAEKGIKYNWIYQPEGYELVVMEHDKDGEKPNSWSVAFFTETEKDAGDEEDLFGESMLMEQGKEAMEMLEQTRGNFLDIVKIAIEVASSDAYKKGFTAATVKQAVSKAKK